MMEPVEEKVRALREEVERLVRERNALLWRVEEAERRQQAAEAAAASWRRKLVALADHTRRRVRGLEVWIDRLSRDREFHRKKSMRLRRARQADLAELLPGSASAND